MRGFDPKTPVPYIVKDERGLRPAERTVFMLKNLTLREAEILKNTLFAKEGTGEKAVERLLLGSQERQALELGLTGWENFLDRHGAPIPFSRENINYIPAKYRAELASEIRGETDLTEEEEKN